jgi:hypothetical protein
LLSQSDSKQAANAWQHKNVLDDDEARNEGDPVFESIDEVFALLTIA